MTEPHFVAENVQEEEYVLDDDFDFEEGICCRCVSEREDTQPLVFSDEPIRLEDIA